jgi:hypothetical protein
MYLSLNIRTHDSYAERNKADPSLVTTSVSGRPNKTIVAGGPHESPTAVDGASA